MVSSAASGLAGACLLAACPGGKEEFMRRLGKITLAAAAAVLTTAALNVPLRVGDPHDDSVIRYYQAAHG
jgi:hypothetical protein